MYQMVKAVSNRGQACYHRHAVMKEVNTFRNKCCFAVIFSSGRIGPGGICQIHALAGIVALRTRGRQKLAFIGILVQCQFTAVVCSFPVFLPCRWLFCGKPDFIIDNKKMFSFIVSFVASALLTLLIIKQVRLHSSALDSDFHGVQKVHSHSVARIGGLSIFLAVVLGAFVSIWRLPPMTYWMLSLLLCSGIAFIGGIAEDFTGKVSPMGRLLLTMAGALLAYFLIDARIDRVDWVFSSWAIPFIWLSLPITVLAVAGIANAINIIDGFNGLASVVSICMLLSLAYVALQVNDSFILVAALLVAGAITGFLIWNYPVGLIFLGDGGAYFIGFMLGELTLLLVMRNPQISTWYAILLLIYPAFETIFSAYRRAFIQGKSPVMPDGIHLHSLIFRRIVQWTVGRKEAKALMRRNSMTSPYLWLFSLTAVIPATLFWRHSWLLILCSLLFMTTYVWLYFRIIRFKSPRWMIMKKKK